MADTATEVGAAAVDWSQRFASHINPDGSVVVPPRIAQMLDQRVSLLSEQRKMLRSSDPEAYEILGALRLSGLGHEQNVFPRPQMSGSGHDFDTSATQQTESEHEQLTTPEAAERLGVTDRTVRRWCATERLPARWHGGRWHISEHDLSITQAAAAA
ncbi:helix-turn-helix domain-containing protein [Mycobacterium paraintracellulare]|uniref:helix-turn-helix domain-containing protein n=1 Tax=Mycobacterium paraintracellulare TaxID=1138383 RepID=UPI0019167B7E|nr:helix-turn-helix domain-containing protein [Mycobacterium paraintracellulare]